MSAYADRERQALQALAWQTLNDPKASPDDKRAARERLEQREGKQYDWQLLSVDEMCVEHALLAKARGQWPPLSPGAEMKITQDTPESRTEQLHSFAEHAQIVADDARLELDERIAVLPADAYVRVSPRRCTTCGRYEDGGNRIGDKPVDRARYDRARKGSRATTTRPIHPDDTGAGNTTTDDVSSTGTTHG